MGRRSRTRSGSRVSHGRSRSRSRISKRRRHRNRLARSPRSRSNSVLRGSLQTIITRLNALEDRSSFGMSSNIEVPPKKRDSTEQIVSAINSLKYGGTRDFYVSNFDPNIHDVDAWFDEVDRAQILNKWNDAECLSRIGHCLKGDAKSWLDEWVTTDRSWSNFKRDFKSLCVKKIDVANILYDVMSTNSDSFVTYAEYVRRSLLRLQIVKGLSDELISAIVIRGVNEPNIKAAATNENLKPCELVNYFSTFVKPVENKNEKRANRGSIHSKEAVKPYFANRLTQKSTFKSKCFSCGQTGHKQINCYSKQKPTSTNSDVTGTTTIGNDVKSVTKTICAYCKKTGHHINDCFAKQRSDNRKAKLVFVSHPT
ncbi:hypothetical protein HF086_009727 [Spodoptera exigua]|uniref:CCHC-type domain-containing protein n=1 Tax=Spodoptera exigua TaxID=7107 RepID=A0A922MC17_SPOEX|nr:hypothetical protein HF086_009727 [Spodoptera exigua]